MKWERAKNELYAAVQGMVNVKPEGSDSAELWAWVMSHLSDITICRLWSPDWHGIIIRLLSQHHLALIHTELDIKSQKVNQYTVLYTLHTLQWTLLILCHGETWLQSFTCLSCVDAWFVKDPTAHRALWRALLWCRQLAECFLYLIQTWLKCCQLLNPIDSLWYFGTNLSRNTKTNAKDSG